LEEQWIPMKFIGFFFYITVDVIFKNIFLFLNILKLYIFYFLNFIFDIITSN